MILLRTNYSYAREFLEHLVQLFENTWEEYSFIENLLWDLMLDLMTDKTHRGIALSMQPLELSFVPSHQDLYQDYVQYQLGIHNNGRRETPLFLIQLEQELRNPKATHEFPCRNYSNEFIDTLNHYKQQKIHLP